MLGHAVPYLLTYPPTLERLLAVRCSSAIRKERRKTRGMLGLDARHDLEKEGAAYSNLAFTPAVVMLSALHQYISHLVLSCGVVYSPSLRLWIKVKQGLGNGWGTRLRRPSDEPEGKDMKILEKLSLQHGASLYPFHRVSLCPGPIIHDTCSAMHLQVGLQCPGRRSFAHQSGKK